MAPQEQRKPMDQQTAARIANVSSPTIARWCNSNIICCDRRQGRGPRSVSIPDDETLVLRALGANKTLVQGLPGLRRLAIEVRRAARDHK